MYNLAIQPFHSYILYTDSWPLMVARADRVVSRVPQDKQGLFVIYCSEWRA